MCSIIGSFDKKEIMELIKLNSYRGYSAYSFSVYVPETKDLLIEIRELGDVQPEKIESYFIDGGYGIAHVQAPTSGILSEDRVHPAIFHDACLWHNGILKQSYINKYVQHKKSLSITSEEDSQNFEWDTYILLETLVNNGYRSLDQVDGSFACVAYDGQDIFVFRNQLAPLYMDDYLSLSSTQFGLVSREIPADSFFRINFDTRKLELIGMFKTNTLPYYFGESE